MSIKAFSRVNHLSLLLLIMFIFNVNKALANDADKPASLDGIWSGTIGKQEVLVNFSGSSSTYFYMRYLKSISLYSIASDGEAWVEGGKAHPSATWQLNPVINDEIVGKWLDVDAKRTLPIHLVRYQTLNGFVTDGEDFGNPIVFSEKIGASKALIKSGKRYRKISAMGVSSIELLEGSAGVPLLNTVLKNTLRYEIGAYLSCTSQAEMVRDSVYVDCNENIEISFWNANWISFTDIQSSDCGGAHPNTSFSRSTWNLNTGKVVKLSSWFTYDAEKLSTIIANKAVKQRYAWNKNEKDDCNELFKTEESSEISLGERGLIFSYNFPHVAQACNEDIEVPYKTLLPFLTKEGLRSVKLLMTN